MSEGAYTGWRKSSYSNSSGNCVEAACTDRIVAVRDTKQGCCGHRLEFTEPAWRRFLTEAKDGKAARQRDALARTSPSSRTDSPTR